MIDKIVTCRYKGCIHGGKINKDTDDFVANGRAYYHKDCYEMKMSRSGRDEQSKKDLAEFRRLWCERINNTVRWGALNGMIGEYLKRGVSSDQLLFTLKYVIKHKCKLTYPAGFRYYMDNAEIKKAYSVYIKNKEKPTVTETQQEEQSQCKIRIPKRKTLADLFD